MSSKKKQTSSKKHLKIPLHNPGSTDITYCSANCRTLCYRRKHPNGRPYSLMDLTETCKDFQERNPNANTSTVPKRRS